jgi:hypothetical protein
MNEEVFWYKNLWVKPSPAGTFWFLFVIFLLVGFILVVRYLHARRTQRKEAADLEAVLRKAGILGKPEETVIRDLAERYRVHPPSLLLSSLSHYDTVAAEEIIRVERAPMPLADRIDRIEYLYSIRIQAFSQDPAIVGADAFLAKEEPVSLSGTSVPPIQPLDLAKSDLIGDSEGEPSQSLPPLALEPAASSVDLSALLAGPPAAMNPAKPETEQA